MSLLLFKHIILGLSIAAPIGPINIEILRRGLSQGFWSSLFVGAGGMTADCILMFLMYQGFARLLTIQGVQLTLIIFGAVVLIHTGLQSLLKHKQSLVVNESVHSNNRSLMNSFLTGAFIAAFNPLNVLFWLGIYGSVLSDTFNEDNKIKAFIISSAVFIGIGLWNLNLALIVHFGRKSLNPSTLKRISTVASLIILGFGLHLSYQGMVRILDMM
ncbi:LysE family transporter [Chengkuizengella axinellae]|uniref:LysE family transporter n=1 Tax=Chengkuizengella axinellae TaxID=3064388 RepID=A0ABT9IVK8_9BACL|nr:LysE family transporter [Chengkuizengella sp. 2205SS18-9]MDP5273380.1 LysE family transporter [Chengkuizengella sp. 2205SS18-9]